MNRTAVALVLVLLVAPIAVGGLATAAAAQKAPTPSPTEANTTANTPEPTPTPAPIEDRVAEHADALSSPYDYTWLTQSGYITHEKYPSLRTLPKPDRAFVQAWYQDPSLVNVFFGSEPAWQALESTSTVRTNRVQLRAATTGDYEIVTVFWQENRTRVNDTELNRPVPYAYNQTVERQNVTFQGDELFEAVNVTLPPHFDQTWRVTMWMEQDGERVAKWTFKHRSNPQAKAVAIDSLVGAWAFAFRNALGPALLFGALGMFAGKATIKGWGPIEGVARGPGYGTVTWAILLFFVALFTVPAAGFYYQVAVILDNAGWIMGLLVGLMTYAYRLTDHEEGRLVGFLRRQLYDVRNTDRFGDPQAFPDGPEATTDGGQVLGASDKLIDSLGGSGNVFEELTDAFYSELPELQLVKSDGTYKVAPPGLKQFIAALFVGRPAFDPEEIRTREIITRGRINDLIHIDPGVGEALDYEPPRLVNALPYVAQKRYYAEREAEPTWQGQTLALAMSLGMVLGPPTVLGMAFSAVWNIGAVGVALGIPIAAIFAFTAKEGRVEYVPAPVHYRKAEQHLTGLRRAYKEAKEDETAEERARRLQALTTKEAREDREGEMETYFDVMYGDKELPSEAES